MGSQLSSKGKIIKYFGPEVATFDKFWDDMSAYKKVLLSCSVALYMRIEW
jgi:hypothetical protein